MITRFLTLIFLLCIFSGTSCPSECENFNRSNAILRTMLENPSSTYAVGETIWLNADFPATIMTDRGKDVTIGEGGGLVVNQLFRVNPDTNFMSAGLTAFTEVEDVGAVLERRSGEDPSASLIYFTCPGGTCTYRQGFRADSVGTYILRVSGSTIDRIAGGFDYCAEPGFGATQLENGSAGEELTLNFPLEYNARIRSFQTLLPFIRENDGNYFYFTVQ